MLSIAYDGRGPDRKLVKAADAINGQTYYCPYCGIPVVLAHTGNGTAFFRVLPKKPHLSDTCGVLSENETSIRSEEDLDSKKFIQHLMTVAPPRKSTGTAEPRADSALTADDIVKVLGPSSLLHLYAAGIDKMSPNTPIKDGYVLSDVLLTYNTYPKFLQDSGALGFRALELVPDHAVSQRITFVCYWYNYRGAYFRRYFELTCADPVLYQKAVNKLFHIDGPFGLHKYYKDRKPNLAVVASCWSDVPPDECRDYCWLCRNPSKYCCLGASRGELLSIKQIFCPDLIDGESNTSDDED